MILLFYSPFHRFVHKALVAIHEAGLVDAVELVPSFPFRNVNGEWVEGQYDLNQLNPLGNPSDETREIFFGKSQMGQNK